MITQKLVVQVFADKKFASLMGQGRVLNIAASKGNRGENISVFTVAMVDGSVVTTTDASVKVIIT